MPRDNLPHAGPSVTDISQNKYRINSFLRYHPIALYEINNVSREPAYRLYKPVSRIYYTAWLFRKNEKRAGSQMHFLNKPG